MAIVVSISSLALAGRAGAGQYSCQVPASVLCQGCSSDVAITLEPRGGCRVSFSPAPAWGTGHPSGTVSLQIVTPAAPVSRLAPAPRRKVAWRTRPVAAQPRQASGGRCFSFNGTQYCE